MNGGRRENNFVFNILVFVLRNTRIKGKKKLFVFSICLHIVIFDMEGEGGGRLNIKIL